ncbi:cytochrome c551 [Jeotgalibacillus soli]|uniref:Cytochrome c domain-containing protein n=1 Tax=Jeotgalibacillus soli TaxID=889306 RepID=A0A0C2W1G1_9BACL|nr:cytochrome c [Jeotgalibacillus soli]KIL49958.1 hypothetical protein KP78_14260 [Jeotgalibacillus soli]
MKKGWIGTILSASLMLTACGGAGNDQSSGGASTDSTDPEGIYAGSSCIGCHGENLEGASGPSLQEIGSSLTKDEILETIVEGKGRMPGGLLEGEQAEAVAEWLSEKQ